MVMASQTTQQPGRLGVNGKGLLQVINYWIEGSIPMLEKRRRGRRPTRSTIAAPRSAQQNCWQLLIRITFA